MSGVEPGVIWITQRELLTEMRDDIRALHSVVARRLSREPFGAAPRLPLPAVAADAREANRC